LLGRIFFDTVGSRKVPFPKKTDATTSTDSTTDAESTDPETEAWELADYHRFLKSFHEDTPPTVEECQQTILFELNINLYDLLDYFRNTGTTPRPKKFDSIRDLAVYSYCNGKVFPKWEALQSLIATPLLRPIGQGTAGSTWLQKSRFGIRAKSYVPAKDAAKKESEVLGETASTTSDAASATATTATTTTLIVAPKTSTPSVESIEAVMAKLKGSLTLSPDTIYQPPPTLSTPTRVTREQPPRKRRGAISTIQLASTPQSPESVGVPAVAEIKAVASA
jgi:hypothetical protein